jgi:hypothetical protein
MFSLTESSTFLRLQLSYTLVFRNVTYNRYRCNKNVINTLTELPKALIFFRYNSILILRKYVLLTENSVQYHSNSQLRVSKSLSVDVFKGTVPLTS